MRTLGGRSRFWTRAVRAVLARPPVCGRRRSRQAGGSPARGGGAARRSCPCPTATTSGSGSRPSTARDGASPSPRDLVTYLEWCRDMTAPAPGHGDR